MNVKRDMWVRACWLFAVMWGILGVFIWPFLLFALMSVMMIMIPVGVNNNSESFKPKHNPDKWGDNDTSRG